MSAPEESGKGQLLFETLNVRQEGAVLFVEISAPPINLLGPALVRDLVSLIQLNEANDAYQVLVFKSADPDYFISHVDVTRIKENRDAAAKLIGGASIVVKERVNAIALAPAEDIRRDSDLFLEGTQSPEFQERTQAAMKRGFQTRDAEMNLARMVGDLDEHGTNQADHRV